MIVILKQEARQAQIDRLTAFFNQMGLKVHLSQGEHSTIMGLVGDTTRVDEDMIATLDDVEAVRRIQEPYKKANRKFHPADTVVDCGGVKLGGGMFQIIAGPCSVESEGRQGSRRHAPSRRRIQAAHFALRLPGAARRGHPPAGGGKEGNGLAHCDGDHGRQPSASV